MDYKCKKGFSLLELSIVMAVITFISMAVVPSLSSWIKIKYGEKTVQEMTILAEASRNYFLDNAAWPANVNDLKTGNYINNLWVVNNPWGNPYNIAINGALLDISTTVPTEVTKLVQTNLPAATIAGNTVTSSIPYMASGDSLDAFSVVMWRGALTDVPVGWQLCDGTNTTPDLRDRFVVGAGTLYNLNDTGGSITHNHGGSTNAGNNVTSWVDDHSGGDDHIVSSQWHTHTIPESNHLPPYYGLYYICKG